MTRAADNPQAPTGAYPAGAAVTDAAHDIFRQERQPLDVIFKPKSVAVIGATENANSVGRTILQNLLLSPFGGTVFPVNPKRPNVLGVKAYPSVSDIPDQVDLAVIVTPAKTVPGLIEECAKKGVKGAIVISAGFKETGPEGVELERRVLEAARNGSGGRPMRIIGPNCLGVMNPIAGLNATFAKGIARPGNVAFISQSGALLTAILDWSFREKVGFSAFVSTGSMLDVGFGDLIDYFGNDPRTRSILVYMESIGDARRFLTAAREVSLSKPIIVIKPGRTEQAAAAAASHTGSLTGSDDVLDAAFRRVGVLRVQNIADLFYMAEVLAKQPVPKGPRLTVITNAGGPGVLATDALISSGGELAEVSQPTIEQLNTFLPASWSHNNPIDVLGDATAERYAKTLEVAGKDPNSDGLLVILTPQDMTQPTETADLLRQYAQIEGKPVLASWMGGPAVAAGEDVLNNIGIPTFAYPDTAARMFTYMHQYARNLKLLYETPTADPDDHGAATETADKLIKGARDEGRTTLTEAESKELLAAYGIPTVETVVAETADAAGKAAERIGFPVVVKLHSKTITHKTDVGGVKLNLRTADDVKAAFNDINKAVGEKHHASDFLGVTVQPMVKLPDAYELIVGSSPDPQFGPVMLFGSGGTLVEVFKDRAVALPPLTATLARRMMERTKVHHALGGVRGRPPVDQAALERLLVRFSRLVVEQRLIREIDINPLLVSHAGMVALDARVIVYPPETKAEEIVRPAIRPYPTQYVHPWKDEGGETFTLRPIRPDDEPKMVEFHQMLSEESVRLRYFAFMKLDQRTAHERLTRVCFNDYSRELALVAETKDGKVAGVGRLSKIPGLSEAEWSMIVGDPYQKRGLGTQLLSDLVNIARAEGLERVSATILNENTPMQRVAKKLGFQLKHDQEEGVVRAVIGLK